MFEMASQLRCSNSLRLSDHGSSRRRWQRFPTIRRLAVISNGRMQGLARVNNISDGGVCLTVAEKLPTNSSLTIRLADDIVLRGRIAWSRGTDCGVILDEKIDCRFILSAATQSNCRPQSQGLTLHTDAPIQVVVDEKRLAGKLRELTLHSCKIEGLAGLQRNQPLKVVFAPDVVKKAFVCGHDGDCTGILFCELLDISDLGMFRLGSDR
jgi:hypothetical protein